MAAGNSSMDVGVHDGAQGRLETPTRRQLRLQRVEGGAAAPESQPTPATDQRTGTVRPPLPGGRRDRRRRQGAALPAEDMSVEEAPAARQSIADDAAQHLADLRAAGTKDSLTVDPTVLAQQKALAARAAALTSRALRAQRQPEQDQQRPPEPLPVADDPTTAHNLSIIAPPDMVRVPGTGQSVLRAPRTSSIAVVLPARRKEPREGAAPDAGTEPVGARNAFGLDPLDAMTAGLGRLRRMRYLQYAVLVVGATALTTGIMMTVSSLNG
ncbi:hypothetical protein [Arthrobacter sp. TMS2-4]